MDEEEIRRLKGLGLTTSQIADALEADYQDVAKILARVYKDPWVQLTDEYDAARQQYDQIISNDNLDVEVTKIKLEAIKNKLNVLDRKKAILEKQHEPKKEPTSEVDPTSGLNINNKVSIQDRSLMSDKVSSVVKPLEKTLLKNKEKAVIVLDALGLSQYLRDGVYLTDEFEEGLSEEIGIPLGEVQWARKVVKNEPEKAQEIKAKAKRRGFKLQDFGGEKK